MREPARQLAAVPMGCAGKTNGGTLPEALRLFAPRGIVARGIRVNCPLSSVVLVVAPLDILIRPVFRHGSGFRGTDEHSFVIPVRVGMESRMGWEEVCRGCEVLTTTKGRRRRKVSLCVKMDPGAGIKEGDLLRIRSGDSTRLTGVPRSAGIEKGRTDWGSTAVPLRLCYTLTPGICCLAPGWPLPCNDGPRGLPMDPLVDLGRSPRPSRVAKCVLAKSPLWPS